jgi:hypothetical protein
MSEPKRAEPSPEDLDALKREIEERFPGWTFVGVGNGYGDWILTAERIGTIPDRQYGTSPAKLLEAIEYREAQQSRTRAVGVQTGPQAG